MRRYKTANGDYLTVTEIQGNYYICWYIAADKAPGYIIGESHLAVDKEPKRRENWENWAAYTVIAPFSFGRDGIGFVFRTKASVQRALLAADSFLRNNYRSRSQQATLPRIGSKDWQWELAPRGYDMVYQCSPIAALQHAYYTITEIRGTEDSHKKIRCRLRPWDTVRETPYERPRSSSSSRSS